MKDTEYAAAENDSRRSPDLSEQELVEMGIRRPALYIRQRLAVKEMEGA